MGPGRKSIWRVALEVGKRWALENGKRRSPIERRTGGGAGRRSGRSAGWHGRRATPAAVDISSGAGEAGAGDGPSWLSIFLKGEGLLSRPHERTWVSLLIEAPFVLCAARFFSWLDPEVGGWRVTATDSVI